MNYTDYRLSLDIFKTVSQATLPVKQGDTAYRLCITITANGSPYKITEGCYALFTAKKPDGNFINNKCTIENNTIYYQLTPQTTAAIGMVECEIVLYDANDAQLATPHFNIFVDKKAYNGEEITSSSEVNMLEDLIKESQEQIKKIENIKLTYDEETESLNFVTQPKEDEVLLDNYKAYEHNGVIPAIELVEGAKYRVYLEHMPYSQFKSFNNEIVTCVSVNVPPEPTEETYLGFVKSGLTDIYLGDGLYTAFIQSKPNGVQCGIYYIDNEGQPQVAKDNMVTISITRVYE